MKQKFTREMNIMPAFDKRNADPTKNYGIHSCEVWFIVKGSKGALTIHFGTNWYLKSTVIAYKAGECRGIPMDLEKGECASSPLRAYSIDRHAYKRINETDHRTKCCSFNGNKCCYQDGSFCGAEKYTDILTSKGSEGVFLELEKDYASWFTKSEWFDGKKIRLAPLTKGAKQ